MSSLLEQLEKEALDTEVTVSALLRRALVVATRLQVPELVDWVKQELHGYPENGEAPEYRHVRGAFSAVHPYRGIIPAFMDDPHKADLISQTTVGSSVAELESLLKHESSPPSFMMPFNKDIELELMKETSFGIRPILVIDRSVISGILDSVRTTLLNWALQLRERGVAGENESFTDAERQEAASVTNNISNFYGPVHHAQVQQGATRASQSMVIGRINPDDFAPVLSEIRSRLDELSLGQLERSELEADLETVEQQLRSPNPKRAIVAEAMLSIRSILESAAGSAVFLGIVKAIDALPL